MGNGVIQTQMVPIDHPAAVDVLRAMPRWRTLFGSEVTIDPQTASVPPYCTSTREHLSIEIRVVSGPHKGLVFTGRTWMVHLTDGQLWSLQRRLLRTRVTTGEFPRPKFEDSSIEPTPDNGSV